MSKITTQEGVWDSRFGHALRWILFLPVGLLVLYLAEMLLTTLVAGIASLSLHTLVVIAVLIGATGILWFPLVMVATLSATATAHIAPNPQVGVIVLGLVYVVTQILAFFFLIGEVSWIQPLVKALFTAITVLAFTTTFQEKVSQRT